MAQQPIYFLWRLIWRGVTARASVAALSLALLAPSQVWAQPATQSATQATAQATSQATAQLFPDRAVQVVVPYPPAGLTDNIARYFSAKLKDIWNQPVVVENKPGASRTRWLYVDGW
jgi:hypothetical protein